MLLLLLSKLKRHPRDVKASGKNARVSGGEVNPEPGWLYLIRVVTGRTRLSCVFDGCAFGRRLAVFGYVMSMRTALPVSGSRAGKSHGTSDYHQSSCPHIMQAKCFRSICCGVRTWLPDDVVTTPSTGSEAARRNLRPTRTTKEGTVVLDHSSYPEEATTYLISRVGTAPGTLQYLGNEDVVKVPQGPRTHSETTEFPRRVKMQHR